MPLAPFLPKDWNDHSQRLLVILENTPEECAIQNTLNTKIVMNPAMYPKHGLPVAIFPFSDRDYHNLKPNAKGILLSKYRAKCLAFIEKYKPTHVIFSGNDNPWDIPFNQLGWVYKKNGVRVTTSLDLDKIYSYKGGVYANAVGLFIDHLNTLLGTSNGRPLQNIEPSPVYVDTLEKFEKLLAKLEESRVIAIDTETAGLSVHTNNALYTVQFSVSSTKAYIVPVDHPTTPFSKEDLKIVKQKLRKFFASTGKELVFFNGKFDLRILRVFLKVEFIRHKIWEIRSGEHALDEGVQLLVNFKPKGASKLYNPGNLANTVSRYGNDFYYGSAFGKDDRSTIGHIACDNPDFLKYAAMDVQTIFGVRDCQLQRAEKQGRLNSFRKHMLYQMGPTEHQLSLLEQNGSLVSIPKIKELVSKKSPIIKIIEESTLELSMYPQVIQANKLVAQKSSTANPLFGTPWVFSWTKGDHLKTLFFEVLQLAPLSKTKSGKDAIDKEFIAFYKDRSFIVDLYGQLAEARTVARTFLTGVLQRLELSEDKDSKMRSRFDVFNVDTGRLGSADPNQQNFPSRGKLAKLVKSIFISAESHILIKYDYSAHEVRCWAIAANDEVLGSVFETGRQLRRKLIKNPTEEIRQEIKKKGDLHILNVKRFFNKWVEKSDPLREAVKSVIFGAIYLMTARTLGRNTKKPEIVEIQALMRKARDEKQPIEPYMERLEELLEEDRTEYANNILNKLFSAFKKSSKWLDSVTRSAAKKQQAESPIGRVRHLWATLFEDKSLTAKQIRRGANAPIQGFGSEIGVVSSYLICNTWNKLFPKVNVEFSRIIHDASYFHVPIEYSVEFIHVMSYMATTGVADYYERHFGLKMVVNPEIEIELGVSDDKFEKWNWELPSLVSLMEKTLKDKGETHSLKHIFRSWKNNSMKNFPLLNVELSKELRTEYQKLRA